MQRQYADFDKVTYTNSESNFYDQGLTDGKSGKAYKNPGYTQSERTFYRTGYTEGKLQATLSTDKAILTDEDKVTQVKTELSKLQIIARVAVKKEYISTTYSVYNGNKLTAKGDIDKVLQTVKSYVRSELLFQQDIKERKAKM